MTSQFFVTYYLMLRRNHLVKTSETLYKLEGKKTSNAAGFLWIKSTWYNLENECVIFKIICSS